MPIKTVSEANASEHWTKKSKRHKQQQHFVRLSYNSHVKNLSLPCTITLTRLSPRLLDDDNLLCALKYIRDELSECIFPEKSGFYVDRKGHVRALKGRADADPRLKWRYEQEKSRLMGVRICID